MSRSFRISTFIVVFVAFAVTTLGQAASAQDKKPPASPQSKVDQQRVDAAVEQGAQYLLGKLQNGLGEWKHPTSKELTYDELVLYTLIHAGTDRSLPEFRKLLDALLDKECRRTYCTACLAMALCALDKNVYQWKIAECGQFLVDNQCTNGQWGYGEPVGIEKKTRSPGNVSSGGGNSSQPEPGAATRSVKKVPINRRRKGPESGDNSNSQYAVLGLRACMESGVEIPQAAFKDAKSWWEKSQGTEGGWDYAMNGTVSTASAAYGSMSAGGAGCLAICNYYLGNKKFMSDKKILSAINWLTTNFTVTENKGYGNSKMWHYYYLYALERTGILLGTETFGQNEWYPLGAEFLLDSQDAAGSWNGSIEDTCFAILFLRRATVPLPKTYSGK
jgi:hypothetical protein